jgi:hypothetical protein
LIDPFVRVVDVYRPAREVDVRTDLRVCLDPELPGFMLDAVAIMELANPTE